MGCCGSNDAELQITNDYKRRFESTFSSRRSQISESKQNSSSSSDSKPHQVPEICSESDTEEALDVLVKAFSDPHDDMFQWIVDASGPKSDKEANERFDLQAGYMLRFVNLARFSKGIVLIARDTSDASENSRIVGVAALEPPGVNLDKLKNHISAAIKYGPPPCQKNKKEWGSLPNERLNSMNVINQKRSEIIKKMGYDDHKYWYLGTIGVLKECRGGQKRGSMLLKALNEMADQDGYPIYLETDTDLNENIYKHFGYETIETFYVGPKVDIEKGTGLKTIVMIRSPKK